MVRQESAKLSFPGSNPGVTSRKKALTFVGAFLLYPEIFCLCSAGEYDMMKLKKSSICFRKGIGSGESAGIVEFRYGKVMAVFC